MNNMAYIRFENTLADLQECYEHLEDELSESEERARQKLIRLCERIVEDARNTQDTP